MNNFQFPVGKKTIAEYNRQKLNTRAKINRLKKNHNVNLEDEIPIPSLESFSSRKEFNDWTRKVESFRNRSNQHYQYVRNQYDVSASKARLNKIERDNKKAQKQAEKEIEKYKDTPFVSGGVEQGTVGMQRPNKTGIDMPKDFVFEDVKSEQRLKEIEESRAKKASPYYYDVRMARMQNNFIKLLEDAFNSSADKLIEDIKTIDPEEFFQLYLSEDEFDFEQYFYPQDGNDLENDAKALGKMRKAIKKYKKGQADTDLWHGNFS